MSENQALSYLILASLLLLFSLNPTQSATDFAHRANILELNDKKVNAAINNSSLLVLDCYAAWCEPCMNLNATIHELSHELKVPITFEGFEKLINRNAYILLLPYYLVYENPNRFCHSRRIFSG